MRTFCGLASDPNRWRTSGQAPRATKTRCEAGHKLWALAATLRTVATDTCDRCGRPVVWLRTYRGSQPFEPETVTHGDVSPEARWYRKRGTPGLVTGAMIDAPPTAPFLLRHTCYSTSSAAPTGAPLIAHTEGPRVADMEALPVGYEWGYRWPSSWAHISREGTLGVAMCSARLGEHDTPRELERMATMPVCSTCVGRVTAWVELSGITWPSSAPASKT